MLKYLKSCEENILEYLVWERNSIIWVKLNDLKLKSNKCGNSENDHPNYRTDFPLFDDVFVSNHIAASNRKDFFSVNLNNNLQSDINSISSNKHPAITQVVCSNSSSVCSCNLPDGANKKKIQLLTFNPSSTLLKTSRINCCDFPNKRLSNSTANRFQNLNKYLSYFFRKFYYLVSIRIKYFIDELDLVNRFKEISASSDIKGVDSQQITEFRTSILSKISTPNYLTWVNNNYLSNNPKISPETYQRVYKKILNLFEYSISFKRQSDEKNTSLLIDRHLDQILMCAVYTTCTINKVSIQFKDIINVYRKSNDIKNFVYRKVLIESEREDLVSFYNKIYYHRIKSYMFEKNDNFNKVQSFMANSEMINFEKKTFCTAVNNLSSFSIPNKLSNINSNFILPKSEFSPKKVMTDMSLYISPGKSNDSKNRIQSLQSNYRNRLLYSLNDSNQIKVIFNVFYCFLFN